MSNPSPKREQIVGLLELFASEQQQSDYERDVPHIDITAELVCMWFDDQYFPGRGFDQFFSAAELAALDEFHHFYEQRVNRLPKSQGTVRTWLASPVWREVMEQARRTLDQIAA